jgi:hypothetical protein
MNYIVSFDINRETDSQYKQAHQKITNLLRALGGARVNLSVWALSTRLGPRLLFNILSRQLDEDDSLVVAPSHSFRWKVKNPRETPPPTGLQRLLLRRLLWRGFSV